MGGRDTEGGIVVAYGLEIPLLVVGGRCDECSVMGYAARLCMVAPTPAVWSEHRPSDNNQVQGAEDVTRDCSVGR